MNPSLAVLCPLFATTLATTEAPATRRSLSDPVGVYALVDRVELLPNAEAPTTAKIYGAFAIGVGYGDYYTTPAHGYLWFGPDDKPDECVKQWRELESLAGNKQPVGFSSRHGQENVRLWRAGDPDARPGKYSTWMGLHKLEGIDYGPARELRLLPTPLSPVASAAPKATPSPRRVARKLTFTVTNCLHQQDDLGYLFSVETSAGEAVASALLTPGDTTTSWTTEVALLPGDQVTWRARVVGKDIERAPVASATFDVGTEEDKR